MGDGEGDAWPEGEEGIEAVNPTLYYIGSELTELFNIAHNIKNFSC